MSEFQQKKTVIHRRVAKEKREKRMRARLVSGYSIFQAPVDYRFERETERSTIPMRHQIEDNDE
jgi:hypothetical protein